MFSLPTLSVIMLLALKFHTVQSGKCPKFCICDNIQLTVACVNKNLTEVPPTIDEVICAPPWSLWPYFFLLNFYKLCNALLLCCPLYISKITVKLDLRGNDMQELPTGAFTHTPYLTHLSLQNSNIRRVREGAFRRLGRLVLLNLANNKIEILYQVRKARHDGLVFIVVVLDNLCMHLIHFSPNKGVIWWAFIAEAANYWPKQSGGDPAWSFFTAWPPQPPLTHTQPIGVHT